MSRGQHVFFFTVGGDNAVVWSDNLAAVACVNRQLFVVTVVIHNNVYQI